MLIIVVFLVVWMDAVLKNRQYLGTVKAMQYEIYLITDLVGQLNNNTNNLHHLLRPVLDREKIRQDIAQTTKKMESLSMSLIIASKNDDSVFWLQELQAYFVAQEQFLDYVLRDEIDNTGAALHLFDSASLLHRQLMGRMNIMLVHK